VLKKGLIFFVIDLLLVTFSFLLITWIRPGSVGSYFSRYYLSFIIFIVIWIGSSIPFKKYAPLRSPTFKNVILPIVISNLVALGTISVLMYFFRTTYYSRTIVLGTILLASFFEFLFSSLYFFLKIAIEYQNPPDNEYLALRAQQLNGNSNHADIFEAMPENGKAIELSGELRKPIIDECGEEGLSFILKNNCCESEETLLVATTTSFNIETQPDNRYRAIINLKRINDIAYLNRFFEAVNSKIPKNGTFIGCVETKNLRKQRIFKKYPFLLNYFYYYFLDFPVKRLMPKFKITSGLYHFLTRGQNRVITRAETLGRLISCGFDIVNEAYIDSLFYFAVKKVGEPSFDPNPTYGPLVRLKRIGKEGKAIKVLKMRTMHPYAEYLQDYMYKMHNLTEGGKFDFDFRVSTQGRIMRKLWIDELPMLFNWFKGDLKLVGVRPISEHYFNLYDKEVREKRTKYKPGLIPPFYADLPKSLGEIQESEMRYLEAYEKKPFRTDWRYFWKAMYNIVIKRARSQ